MNKPQQTLKKSVAFLGAICGGILMGLSSVPKSVVAQELNSLNRNQIPKLTPVLVFST